MLIPSLKLICLLLEIFQRIANVYAKEKKYSIGRRQIIDGFGGKPTNTGIEIEITNQIDVPYLFEFKLIYHHTICCL